MGRPNRKRSGGNKKKKSRNTNAKANAPRNKRAAEATATPTETTETVPKAEKADHNPSAFANTQEMVDDAVLENEEACDLKSMPNRAVKIAIKLFNVSEVTRRDIVDALQWLEECFQNHQNVTFEDEWMYCNFVDTICACFGVIGKSNFFTDDFDAFDKISELINTSLSACKVDCPTSEMRDDCYEGLKLERAKMLTDLVHLVQGLVCQKGQKNKLAFVQGHVKVLNDIIDTLLDLANPSPFVLCTLVRLCELIYTLGEKQDGESNCADEVAILICRSQIAPRLHRLLTSALPLIGGATWGYRLAHMTAIAIEKLAVNDETIQSFIETGLLETTLAAVRFSGELDRSKHVEVAMLVIACLVKNEEVGTRLCTDGITLPTVLEYGMRRHEGNQDIQERGCYLIASMAQCHPKSIKVIMELDGARDILKAIQRYEEHVQLRFYGTSALFHIAETGSAEVHKVLLDLGAEVVLREVVSTDFPEMTEVFQRARDFLKTNQDHDESAGLNGEGALAAEENRHAKLGEALLDAVPELREAGPQLGLRHYAWQCTGHLAAQTLRKLGFKDVRDVEIC